MAFLDAARGIPRGRESSYPPALVSLPAPRRRASPTARIATRRDTMTLEAIPPTPIYEKPTIEVLGSFAQLTLWSIDPNKWSSFSDLSQGIANAINDGGIGS
jgi:hypothetical protein